MSKDSPMDFKKAEVLARQLMDKTERIDVGGQLRFQVLATEDPLAAHINAINALKYANVTVGDWNRIELERKGKYNIYKPHAIEQLAGVSYEDIHPEPQPAVKAEPARTPAEPQQVTAAPVNVVQAASFSNSEIHFEPRDENEDAKAPFSPKEAIRVLEAVGPQKQFVLDKHYVLFAVATLKQILGNEWKAKLNSESLIQEEYMREAHPGKNPAADKRTHCVELDRPGLERVAREPISPDEMVDLLVPHFGGATKAKEGIDILHKQHLEPKIVCLENDARKYLGPFWKDRLHATGIRFEADSDIGDKTSNAQVSMDASSIQELTETLLETAAQKKPGAQKKPR